MIFLILLRRLEVLVRAISLSNNACAFTANLRNIHVSHVHLISFTVVKVSEYRIGM